LKRLNPAQVSVLAPAIRVYSRAALSNLPVPEIMKAWVLGNPGQLSWVDRPVPRPAKAEVLLRVDAAAICATDLDVLDHGLPAMINGGSPFNQNHILGHEYMGTIVDLGSDVDEFRIGERVAVEVHAGCGRCVRCRSGMYTSCLNYGHASKGHRANGFTTDGGFSQYVVNHINTLVKVPDGMSNAEATLAVTAGTSMYGLDELGGLIAGQSLVVIGPGPIGLLGVAVGKALGASPVILAGTRTSRLELGRRLGADRLVNIREEDPVETVRSATEGRGVDLVLECSGSADALNQAGKMLMRGGRLCLAAFPHDPILVDVAQWVRNNIYIYAIRGEGKSAVRRAMALMEQRRFDAKLVHTHTFPMEELPEALRFARNRIEDAIKVVVEN
jgi:L-iditol 2-dehydrogenase